MKIFSLLLVIVFAFIFSLTISAQDTSSQNISGWTKGSQNASIRLEVFNDYQCPACASFNEKLKSLENKFPNDLQIIFRQFPLTAIHSEAMLAAQTAEAAGLQNKFWEMSDLLLERQRDWAGEKSARKIFVKYARELSLDIEMFKLDLESQKLKDKIETDVKRAKDLNVSGTPTVFLNEKKLSFEELGNLEKIIKDNLNK